MTGRRGRRVTGRQFPVSRHENTFERAYRQSRVMLYSVLVLTLPLAVSLTGALESFKRLALVLVGFSAIIFVHELGHFIVARLCSVRCDVFSIGIGPRMLGWKKGVGFSIGKSPEDRVKQPASTSDEKTLGEKEDEKNALKPLEAHKPEEETVEGAARGAVSFGDLEQTATVSPSAPGTVGETDYRISWLPLGGYVRMLGQDDMDPTKISSDPRSFNRRPIWQRMCIVSAGVVMNVITAAVIFSAIFHPNWGVRFPPAIVGEVQYNSPAASGGMQPGYQIVKIDDDKPLGFMEFTDLMIASALSRGVDPVKFHIRRPDDSQDDLMIKPGKIPGVRFLAIGVSPLPSTQLLTIATDEEWRELMKDVKNGEMLMRGDQIVSIDGTELMDPTPESTRFDGGYVKMSQIVQASGGKDVTVVVKNPKRAAQEAVTLTPKFTTRETVGDAPGILGMYPRVRVLGVDDGSPAAKAGLKEGDIILQVGSLEFDQPNVNEFRSAVGASAGKEITITVLRDNEKLPIKVTPAKAQDENKKTVGRIGIALAADFDHPMVTTRDEDPRFPAESFRGATITEINGQKIGTWADIYSMCREMRSSQTLHIKMTLAGGKEMPFDLPLTSDGKKLDPIIASIASPVPAYKYALNLPVENLMWTQKASASGGVGEAMRMGMQHTWKFMQQTYLTLRGLFIGTVSAKELHGIVGIAKVGYDVQDRGLTHLWFILAVVSVNLAVANFLPLPIVDGGLFLLLILEKVRGRPLSLKVQSAIQIVGIVALAGLFLFVTYNDILFVGWGK